jgi:hypothetical protein
VKGARCIVPLRVLMWDGVLASRIVP